MFTFEGEIGCESVIEGALYTIQWPSASCHSLDEMAKRLQDVEYLTDFFTEHQERLRYFHVSVTEAVWRTRKESNDLLQELLDLAKNAEIGQKPDLEELFEPLHQKEFYQHLRFYTDYKAKGDSHSAPWVRIYAAKCDENLYVITGYGIKLVRQMKDDPLLVLELKKLRKATDFLKTLGML